MEAFQLTRTTTKRLRFDSGQGHMALALCSSLSCYVSLLQKSAFYKGCRTRRTRLKRWVVMESCFLPSVCLSSSSGHPCLDMEASSPTLKLFANLRPPTSLKTHNNFLPTLCSPSVHLTTLGSRLSVKNDRKLNAKYVEVALSAAFYPLLPMQSFVGRERSRLRRFSSQIADGTWRKRHMSSAWDG